MPSGRGFVSAITSLPIRRGSRAISSLAIPRGVPGFALVKGVQSGEGGTRKRVPSPPTVDGAIRSRARTWLMRGPNSESKRKHARRGTNHDRLSRDGRLADGGKVIAGSGGGKCV